MKTIATLLIIGLLSTFAFSAEGSVDVSLRYSRQGGMIRVVLESSDEAILNSNVHASPAGIRVDLPFAFELTKPADFIFETAKTERSLSIYLKDVKAVRTTILGAPPRIVFDMTTSPPQLRETMPPGPVVSPNPRTETPSSAGAPRAGRKGPLIIEPEQRLPGVRVAVLDPGHGGYEYGIVEGGAREKDVNLAISRELGAALARRGKTVFLTRKADQSASLADRISFANARNPDLFVSIHAGLSDNYVIYLAPQEDQNVDATVRLYALSYRQARYIDKSRAAATAIGLSITNDFKTGVTFRELPLPVLDSLNAPAILIEYPALKSYASDRKMREKLASSIMKGIAAYER
jgi:N-acetylmuramoyl-L-alanine amidase